MKIIKSIEMATDELLYGVTLGDELTIIDTNDGYFEIHEDGKCIEDSSQSAKDAAAWAKEYATDDGNILTRGYGTNSSRKFWQLPESIQNEALKIAGF
jgi:hypothetical protein